MNGHAVESEGRVGPGVLHYIVQRNPPSLKRGERDDRGEVGAGVARRGTGASIFSRRPTGSLLFDARTTSLILILQRLTYDIFTNHRYWDILAGSRHSRSTRRLRKRRRG